MTTAPHLTHPDLSHETDWAIPVGAAIRPEELLARAAEAGSLLIDIRARRVFHRAHIPGSHSIPSGVLLASEPPEGDLLLIGTDSLDGQQLIDQLHEKGYNRQIRYLEGGFCAWVAGTNPASTRMPYWKRALIIGQQLIAGPLVLITATGTQSIGLLALGFALLFTPWTLRRIRA